MGDTRHVVVYIVFVMFVMCGCERGHDHALTNQQEQGTADVHTEHTAKHAQQAQILVNTSQLENAVSQYDALLVSASSGKLYMEQLSPADVSNMHYEVLMPLRDQIYLLQNRKDAAVEIERIARMLLHCTNMALYHRTELLMMLGNSLRAQEQLSRAAEMYNAIIEYRLHDGPGATDGDAITACLVLQAMYGEAGVKQEHVRYARMGYDIAQQQQDHSRTRDAPALVYAQALMLNGDAKTAYRVLSDTPWVSEDSRQCATRMMEEIPTFVQRLKAQAHLRQMTEERMLQLPAVERALIEEKLEQVKTQYLNQ